MRKKCWTVGALAAVLVVGLAADLQAACGHCGGGGSVDYGAPACGAPGYGSLTPGCCEYPPSCCDNIWDGYCEERRCGRGWGFCWPMAGCRKMSTCKTPASGCVTKPECVIPASEGGTVGEAVTPQPAPKATAPATKTPVPKAPVPKAPVPKATIFEPTTPKLREARVLRLPNTAFSW